MLEREGSVFPLFLKLKGRKILVVGAGNIASRRISTLLGQDAQITVIAPELPLIFSNDVKHIADIFNEKYLSDYDIVLACTNDRSVNHAVYCAFKNKKTFINVCDAPEECDFYFPAIAESEELICGVVSKKGNRHKLVKETKLKIAEIL